MIGGLSKPLEDFHIHKPLTPQHTACTKRYRKLKSSNHKIHINKNVYIKYFLSNYLVPMSKILIFDIAFFGYY